MMEKSERVEKPGSGEVVAEPEEGEAEPEEDDSGKAAEKIIRDSEEKAKTSTGVEVASEQNEPAEASVSTKE